MKDMMFFDSDCQIGNTIFGARPDVDALLKEMDFSGVDYALVRHNNLSALGAEESNKEIAKMLAQDSSSRLCGVWSILPEQCDEQPPRAEFFQAMRQNKIKALTLDPVHHRFEARKVTIGKLMAEIAERKIPVMLNYVQYQWEKLYDFMERFPELTCIVCAGQKWGNDRYIRPLLENYSNLYINTCGYWVPEGIYDLTKLYGAERILYGSGFP